MNAAAVRLVRQALIEEGFAPGIVDGKLGPDTYGAVTNALLKRQDELASDWQGWTNSRKAVAYLQCLCKEHQIEAGTIDGYWGPQTDFAFNALSQLLKNGEMPPLWRDEGPFAVNPNGWPDQNEADLNTFYGTIGLNQTKLVLPYPHRVAWNLRQTIHSFSCNSKVRDSAQRALTKVFEHYGMERIKEFRLDRWGGCFNVRKMRGGSKWSMHSWGIAIDYDPDRNQLQWGRDKAAFAQPEYDAWWRFWEEEGWVSLGRTRNYDWMHVQAVKL